MRRLLLAAALVVGACGAPAAAPRAPARALNATPAVFLSEGGLLRPIVNGARVPIAAGSVELSFTPYPPATTTQLDVVVRDVSGQPQDADIAVVYDMIGMDHGAALARAVVADGRHRAKIGLPMAGPWRFALQVKRAGDVQSLLFIVPAAP